MLSFVEIIVRNAILLQLGCCVLFCVLMSFLFAYIEREGGGGGEVFFFSFSFPFLVLFYKFDLFLLDELLLDIVKVNIYGKSFYFFYFP